MHRTVLLRSTQMDLPAASVRNQDSRAELAAELLAELGTNQRLVYTNLRFMQFGGGAIGSTWAFEA